MDSITLTLTYFTTSFMSLRVIASFALVPICFSYLDIYHNYHTWDKAKFYSDYFVKSEVFKTYHNRVHDFIKSIREDKKNK